jgi:hypothetical protein
MPNVQPDFSFAARLQRQLWPHGEAIAFWLIAAAHLIPVWSFRFLPTQDGPSHINNAQILKNYTNPTSGYKDVFELRDDPLPNLTSHVLLAALMYVVPPLIAEKILVSAYVLGFAAAFRYFLGGFGARCRPLSWLGLLFVFNRCFWLGFYNYCLSLVLLWVILGFCVRRRGVWNAGNALLLMLLFATEYFTHLAGFLLALAGALMATVLVPPRRILGPAMVALAALPAVCLAMNYFEETRFGRSPAAMKVVVDPVSRLRGDLRESEIENDLIALDDEIFTYHAGKQVSITMVLSIGLVLLTGIMLIDTAGRQRPADDPGSLFPVVFGLLVLGAYLLLPNHLGGGDGGLPNGGFLKTRLAPLPFLFWLAALRDPVLLGPRIAVRATAVVLLGANLVFVTATVAEGNRHLSEFTAGVEVIGRGHRLSVVQAGGWRSPLVDPLLHAADYYCLGTSNINLDNYEAMMPHFPVKFRTGLSRGRANRDLADVVLCWRTSPPGLAGWDEIFHGGRMRVYRRPEKIEEIP